jgi:hypothetical protein
MAVAEIILGIALAGRAAETRRPITDAPEVLAVYAEDWGLDSRGQPGLITAVWGDGYAVWSQDQVKGGSPFFHGRIPKERVSLLLGRLQSDGLFADPRLAHVNFGPDSRFTTMLVHTTGKTLKMQSWHEYAEARGGVIASSGGLEPLEGTARLAALKRQPSDYLYYRAVWGELRAAIQGLLPARGTNVSGETRMVRGVLTWSEQ